jgi:hypothetical protein
VEGKQFFKKKAQATLIFIVTTAGQRWEVIQQNTVLNLGTGGSAMSGEGKLQNKGGGLPNGSRK